MLTIAIMIVALAGLALLVYLLLVGVDESDTWMARTRRRVRGQRVQVKRAQPASPDSLSREHEERQRIEERLEAERSRSTLRDPD
jgi:uncharacterized protein YoxC